MSRIRAFAEDERKRKALAAKAEYEREWRRRNPEKSREYCMRYWLKKAEEMEPIKVIATEAEESE